MALLIRSLLKVLSTFVKEQSILAKVPDSATLRSEAAPITSFRFYFTSFEHIVIIHMHNHGDTHRYPNQHERKHVKIRQVMVAVDSLECNICNFIGGLAK